MLFVKSWLKIKSCQRKYIKKPAQVVLGAREREEEKQGSWESVCARTGGRSEAFSREQTSVPTGVYPEESRSASSSTGSQSSRLQRVIQVFVCVCAHIRCNFCNYSLLFFCNKVKKYLRGRQFGGQYFLERNYASPVH